jgi:O-antigen/teichoic acid export membrane protein
MNNFSTSKSRYEKFSIDVMSLVGSQLLIAVIALVNSVVIARALGVEDRGYFIMAMLLPNILITFTDFGLGAAGTKFVASKKWLPSTVFITNSFIICIRLILISFLASLIIFFYSESFFPGIPQEYLYLGMLQAVSLAIQGLIFPILLGLGKGIEYSLILVFSSLLSLIALTTGWLTVGLSVILALILQISSSALISIYIYFTVFKTIDEVGNYSSKYLKDALSFGSGIYISVLSTFANEKMILLVLNFFGGVVYVSLYTLAQALTERIYLLADAVGTMLMPKIAEDAFNNSRDLTPFVFKITFIITLILSLILIISAEKIITIIYTTDFYESIIIMKTLLIAVIFSSGWRILSQDLNGRGFTKETASINLVIVIISLSLAVILLPKMGLVGAAVASIISYIFGLIFGTLFFVLKTDNVRIKNMIFFSTKERLLFKNVLKYYIPTKKKKNK